MDGPGMSPSLAELREMSFEELVEIERRNEVVFTDLPSELQERIRSEGLALVAARDKAGAAASEEAAAR